MHDFQFLAFPSQLGWMALAWSQQSLAGLTFGYRTAQAARQALGTPHIIGQILPTVKGQQMVESPTNRTAPMIDQWVQRLQAYSEGHRDDFQDVPLLSHGWTRFQQRVVHHCRQIPWGQTCTYSQLAAQAGSARAARAVGNVMATNRFPLIVPCHRVVGSHGSLGGYSAPGGLDTKRWLLAREGSG